jgi:hypothetical protein
MVTTELRRETLMRQLGNAHVIDRLLATKFPLGAILLKLSAQLSRAGASPTLIWVPRLQNAEANELSNGITTSFREANRVHLDLGDRDLIILPSSSATLVAPRGSRGEEARQGRAAC